jgi:hypothetical protein
MVPGKEQQISKEAIDLVKNIKFVKKQLIMAYHGRNLSVATKTLVK